MKRGTNIPSQYIYGHDVQVTGNGALHERKKILYIIAYFLFVPRSSA
jgi:hypothetical protein